MMKKILAVLVTAALAIPAFGTQISLPGDPIIGGQIVSGSTTFDEGTDGFNIPGNNWPPGEAPELAIDCLLYTSPSPRDRTRSRMPSSA